MKTQSNLNFLIQSLVADLKPISWFKQPRILAMFSMLLVLMYLSILMKWHVGASLSEFFEGGASTWLIPVLLIFIVGVNLVLAHLGGNPGRVFPASVDVMPVVLLLSWILFVIFRAHGIAETPVFQFRLPEGRDWACMEHILLMSIFPVCALFFVFKQLAPSRQAWCGALLGLISAVSAAFCMEFLCDDLALTHQLYGHIGGSLFVALTGYVLGHFLLRW